MFGVLPSTGPADDFISGGASRSGFSAPGAGGSSRSGCGTPGASVQHAVGASVRSEGGTSGVSTRSGVGTPGNSAPHSAAALESDGEEEEGEEEESDELRRLRAADGAHRMLALAQAMHSICALTQAPDGSGPIQIRVGLHVGPAVAAVVGTQMLRCVRVMNG